MDPKTALILTLTCIVLTGGFITALVIRFVKIGKILKEHGEKLFGQKEKRYEIFNCRGYARGLYIGDSR